MKKVKKNIVELPKLSDLTNKKSIESYIQDLSLSNFKPNDKVPMFLKIDGTVSVDFQPFVSFGIYEFKLNNSWQVDRDLIKKSIEEAYLNYINRIVDGSWFEYIKNIYPSSVELGYFCLYDDIPHTNKKEWLLTIFKLIQYRSRWKDCYDIPEDIAEDIKTHIDEEAALFLINNNQINSGSISRLLDREFTHKFSNYLRDINSLIYIEEEQWYKRVVNLLKEEYKFSITPSTVLKQDRYNTYAISYSIGKELKRAVFLDYRD